jgi:cytochrome c oxidase subunit II
MYSLDVTAPTVQMFSSLQDYYLLLGGIAGAVVMGYMMYQIAKNRERPGRKVPAYHHEDSDWGSWKSVVGLLCITGTVLAFVEYETFADASLIALPGDPNLNVSVTGQQYSWTFTYPNGYTNFQNLTVPQNQIVILNITSRDVTHGFFIPNLDVGKDAQPGIYNQLWFNATQTGSFTIECRQLCGPGHALMHSTLVVVPDAQYNAWYAKLPSTTTTTKPSTTSSTTTASGGT